MKGKLFAAGALLFMTLYVSSCIIAPPHRGYVQHHSGGSHPRAHGSHSHR